MPLGDATFDESPQALEVDPVLGFLLTVGLALVSLSTSDLSALIRASL